MPRTPFNWPLVVVALLVLGAGSPAADPKPDPVVLPLTTFEVVNLVQQGLGDEAVIRRIRETKSTFHLSPADTQMLKAFGVSNRVLAAMAPERAPVPRPVLPVPEPARLELPAAFTGPGVKRPSSRPSGSWVRDSGSVRITLKFTEERLTITAQVPSPNSDGDTLSLTLDADYSVSPEGLVYGVLTGIDGDDPDTVAELQGLCEHTFSARCRVDGDVLTVRAVKFLGSGFKLLGHGSEATEAALYVAGRYTRDDGSKPAPAPRKPAKPRVPPPPRTDSVHAEPTTQPAAGVSPEPRPLERVGVDFDTLPSPPVPLADLPAAAPARPATNLIGTWSRQVGPVGYALKIGPEQLTLTITQRGPGDSPAVKVALAITADYVLSKDGSTLHGIITGADLVSEDSGPMPENLGELREQWKKLQSMTDQPYALSFRVQDGELFLRNVRLGSGLDAELRLPFELLAGRYTASEGKGPAKPKTITMAE